MLSEFVLVHSFVEHGITHTDDAFPFLYGVDYFTKNIPILYLFNTDYYVLFNVFLHILLFLLLKYNHSTENIIMLLSEQC